MVFTIRLGGLGIWERNEKKLENGKIGWFKFRDDIYEGEGEADKQTQRDKGRRKEY
jgi:hypothetical protein